MKDVYVIVESLKDETVNICKKYSASVILRKKLNLQRKGYALDEAVKEILLKNKSMMLTLYLMLITYLIRII